MTETWQQRYNNVRTITPGPTIVGFNVNLDRVITVTPELLDSALFCLPVLSELRSRLLHSMRTCTAEEWIISDQPLFRQFTCLFADTGHLSIGGQAGIAAVHLASSGSPDVLCIARSPGPETRKILDEAGVHVLDFNPGSRPQDDTVHLVFEYPPGLVPVDDGIIPRNNRFIVSPAHTPESILVPRDSQDALNTGLSQYTRAFLSGYQYLRTDEEFALAADQILLLKKNNPRMRVHVECVSVTDTRVIHGFIRYILPVADSIGLNEHELVLLLDCLAPRKTGPGSEEISPIVQQVKSAREICKRCGLKRLHLHTFGYYILVSENNGASREASLNALLFASRTVATAAQGRGEEISKLGIAACIEAEKVFGPSVSPGIFCDATHTIIVIPTLITQDITKTSGLGDILSSTAFVADPF